MLEVGNGVLTGVEARAHFSMWAIFAAPLIAGNDLRDMSDDTRAILTNREVIAVDQDPLGVEGSRVKKDGDTEVWSKRLADGGRAVALLNRSGAEKTIAVSWTALGYPEHLTAAVRDLWQGTDLAPATGSFSATAPSHGVVLVTIKP
jgi:alpha-galactosidase